MVTQQIKNILEKINKEKIETKDNVILRKIGLRAETEDNGQIFTQISNGVKSMILKCVICLQSKQADKKRVQKLIIKFGDLEKLKIQYKCLNCRPKKTRR